MLREVKDAGWTTRRTVHGRRYDFAAGKHESDGGIRSKLFDEWSVKQWYTAVPVMVEGERTFWWCLDQFWVESEGLDGGDVHALVFERQQRKRRKLEHAHATVAGTKAEKRAPIPREARQVVFERDGGHCVDCGSNFELQFDHVIPVAMGGANTVENLQLLCAPCNKAKGATLG